MLLIISLLIIVQAVPPTVTLSIKLLKPDPVIVIGRLTSIMPDCKSLEINFSSSKKVKEEAAETSCQFLITLIAEEFIADFGLEGVRQVSLVGLTIFILPQSRPSSLTLVF